MLLYGIKDQLPNGIKFIQEVKAQITPSYLMYIETHSLIIISQSLESVCLCPKVASTVYEILLVQKEIIFFKEKDLTQFVLMQLFLKHILKKSCY